MRMMILALASTAALLASSASCAMLPAALADDTQSYSLPIVASKAIRGQMSDQGVSVLSTLDFTTPNAPDDWDKYIEISAGTKNKFIVQFDFDATEAMDQLQSNNGGSSLQSLKINTNTIGASKSQQARTFQIRNYATKKWVKLGNNNGFPAWEWVAETFTLTGSNLADFIHSTNNKIRIRFRSNNSADVSNLDWLEVVVDVDGVDGDGDNGGDGGDDGDNDGTSPWWQPKASDRLTWQWQLQGNIDTSFNVDMYDIDLFDTSAAEIQNLKNLGHTVVCYFSAGTYEGWRDDWKQYFPFITSDEYDGNEKPFAGKMEEWNERWLDIREIDLLAPIMKSRLELAVTKGCDAVEPDNMDSYINNDETGLSLTGADQLAYNKWLATEAHKLGMSIGLKNDVDQLDELVDYFDWALNEQCFQYNECDEYIGSFLAKDKAVFGVEYELNVNQFCDEANEMKMSWLKKTYDLTAQPRFGCEDYSGR